MPKILIIDDEPDLRMALTITLEDHGYEVVEGVDGSEALDLAVAHAPDVVILDLNMPNVGGLAALEILKNDERTSDIPVCILTAIKDPAQEHYATVLGADDFIAKPWLEERLVRRLAELIDRRAHRTGGAMSSDTCVRYEPLSTSPEAIIQDRMEQLTEMIRARHDTWETWS